MLILFNFFLAQLHTYVHLRFGARYRYAFPLALRLTYPTFISNIYRYSARYHSPSNLLNFTLIFVVVVVVVLFIYLFTTTQLFFALSPSLHLLLLLNFQYFVFSKILQSANQDSSSLSAKQSKAASQPLKSIVKIQFI